MTTAFQANAFQNNAFQIDSGPTPRPDTAPNLPGGGAEGPHRRTSMQYRAARQKKEMDEMAMIIEVVMPLLARGDVAPGEIFLQRESPIGDKKGTIQ